MSPLFGSSPTRRRGARYPGPGGRPAGPDGRAGLSALALPWLSAALAWVVGSWVTRVVGAVILPGPDVSVLQGIAVGALPLLHIAVVAGIGVAVLGSSLVRRGATAWWLAGLPVPLVALLITTLRGATSPGARASLDNPDIVALAALALGVLAAFIGSTVVGALRARGDDAHGR